MMVSATPQQVQKLRAKTGAGFMDCKMALESTGGELEKAIQFLREKGKMSAAQKAGRTAAQGLVCAWISPDGKKGSLIEINCETDFVARTQDFIEMIKSLSKQSAEISVESAEKLKLAIYPGTEDSVDAVLKEKIGKLGENILIRRANALGAGTSILGSYIHSGLEKAPDCGTLGVLVEHPCDQNKSEIQNLLKEISMQIAATSPKWIKKEDVPAAVIEQELAIYKEQCKASGKPEAAWDKITQGKLADFYKQFCLLEQPYVRDSKISVQAMIQACVQPLGVQASVKNFLRFKVGEEFN